MTTLTTTLDRRPPLTLVYRFASVEFGGLARRFVRALGFQRPDPIGIGELRVPDTPLARKAG